MQFKNHLIILCSVLTIYLLLTPYEHPYSKPSNSSIKANMHTFQTIVETYAVDSKGIFPESVETLNDEAIHNANGHWIEFKNPYGSVAGLGKSFGNERDSMQHEKSFSKTSLRAGIVAYISLPPYHSYKIYGYDAHAQKIIDKGKTLFLSNS